MSDNLPFIDLRAVFTKTDAAIYFSHLDLNRTVSRALRRSGLDIWMSEGYTPRPHLVFTPPLSLGYKSVCEMVDFRLNLGAELDRDAFFNAFPSSLKILDLYTPERKLKDIMYADYELTVKTNASADRVTEIFSNPVELVKKTKRTEELTDITKFIKKFDCKTDNKCIIMNVTVDCSVNSTLSPAYIFEGLRQNGINTDETSVCRTAFRDAKLNIFR